ncbi:MAG TPA: tRNA uridine-5-carboxymethylaminomethyl(34) synthesis enzyme MnmG [Candidatus Omnitrophica bacterium]|nr:MAG: tRNA uridine-5-carboxymethylaminomethyl(34) synthesis enzyme MnmG [Candidatus Omnitrophota bacterium]RKY43811.1 MAG: tRNA uridine-5-carboxymethylaminomethyl(34) synthesis enzyme MnmG [Candidatus Omnitrophota bacterium]HEC68922.1 tRNA uridine-5-carboxymethylaminomethyl(34) synthesis enzyme MnmG [Candidatus Omnitrophota bacterium]
MKNYEVIVVGAGHAGIEASYISAKLGCSVLLLTLDIDNIGKLSCNPAVGGVAKSHLVREVDVLGGLIGKIADECAVSYRILNKSKGKAVWATRAQVDRFLYSQIARRFLEEEENIKILQAKVKRILVKRKRVLGVETNFGEVFYGESVIISAGTFLKSLIHIGLESFPGGRLYEESSDELFASIKELGFKTKHFKTGTCARLDKRTIDFSKMTEQLPDPEAEPFSFHSQKLPFPQLSCFITYTNPKTHRIILKSLNCSPLYTGKIKAKGVRYCPSLEDKVVKFSDRERHQIFIEPEGRDSLEVYPNGVSTSLPFSVQVEFIRSIEGLENAQILRPGYGIEHGLIDSTQLFSTLESKLYEGLYFAGQVNGTTGYEEASAQGLIAGINASLKVKKKKPFILSRDSAFIGVLIDDLITKGTDEPYRMFTSRCEYRLLLREDNALFRLYKKAYELGTLKKDDYQLIEEKISRIKRERERLKSKKILPSSQLNRVISKLGTSSLKKSITFFEFLKRPEVSYRDLEKLGLDLQLKDKKEITQLEIGVKYEGFINRELKRLKELKNLEKVKIPPDLNLKEISGLSREVIEKLEKFKPSNLKEAYQIPGISISAVFILLGYLKSFPQKRKTKKQK